MDNPTKIHLSNKTAHFFYKINWVSYWSGQPNFWIEDLPISKRVVNAYALISHIVTVFIYAFMLSEILAVFTQKNLTLKQKSDLLIFTISHPLLWSYSVSFSSQAVKVKELLVNILDLKRVYNDEEVEKQMIRKSKLYSSAFIGMVTTSMLMYTFDAIVVVVKKEGTFSSIITAWPMIDDASASANALRVLWNGLWWWMIFRVVSVYAFVFSFVSCMSHQFVDLRSYFNSLNNIFTDGSLNQSSKELKYEAAYKIGIKLHLDSLKCVELTKNICRWLFSGQIILNMTMLVMLISQLLKVERDVMHVVAIAFASFCIITSTGFFMCSAGDVTVEASELCTAMYSSGWQCCHSESSVRIRKLVMTSMVFAQTPVQIKGFGIITLSYQSYVSLVKSTYSVFSLVFQQSS